MCLNKDYRKKVRVPDTPDLFITAPRHDNSFFCNACEGCKDLSLAYISGEKLQRVLTREVGYKIPLQLTHRLGNHQKELSFEKTVTLLVFVLTSLSTPLYMSLYMFMFVYTPLYLCRVT